MQDLNKVNQTIEMSDGGTEKQGMSKCGNLIAKANTQETRMMSMQEGEPRKQ